MEQLRALLSDLLVDVQVQMLDVYFSDLHLQLNEGNEVICPKCRRMYNTVHRKPYHLPCNIEHYICGQCIQDAPRRSGVQEVQCTKCSAVHEADRGANSFHIITLILSTVRDIETHALRRIREHYEVELPSRTWPMCNKHNKAKKYFCMTAGCVRKGAMCLACLLYEDHTEHNYIDIRHYARATFRYQVNRGITFLERALQTPNRD